MEKEEQKNNKTNIEEKIETSKKISVKEACAWSVMDGFGLRYITPFAIALGANNTQIGLLSSIPTLLGNFSQLFTIKAMEKYSRKRIVFWAIFLQAIMWLFIIGAGIFYFLLNIKNQTPSYLLIIIYTLLISVGAVGGPAWNSWMKDLIIQKRGEYFSRRSKIAGIVSVVSMLIAGFILDYFKHTYIFAGFVIIFFIAFVGRSISAYLMLKQYEPEFKENGKYYFSLLEFIKKMKDNNFGRFVIYYSLILFATSIASPFFAVYMLKNLAFNYSSYMAVTLSATISTLIFLPFWGKFSDKYGNVKTIRLTGVLIPIIPLLWLLPIFISSNNSVILWLLIIAEIFAGVIWAGFNLAIGNFIYDAVSRERLAICTAYFSIIAGFGVVLGAFLGGILSSHNFVLFGLSPILTLFLLSAGLRAIAHLFIGREFMEVRKTKEFGIKEAKEKIKNLSFNKFLEYMDINFARGFFHW